MKALRPVSGKNDLSDMGANHFSIGRMVQSLIPGSNVEAKFEREASASIAQKYNALPRGFFCPSDVLTRSLSIASGPTGGFLAGTSVSNFAAALRNKLVTARAGANVLARLKENILIPLVTADPVAGWISEGTGAPESDSTFGQVTMTPKTVSGYTQISRQLALQVEPEVLDGVVIGSLARALGIAIDWAALSGTGTDGRPLGVINTPGVGTTSGAAISWAAITGMEKAVLNANANEETFAYVCHPNVRDLLKTRPKAAGSSSYLCSEDNRLNGYPCFATTQVADGLLIAGDFSQLYIAEWGAHDILVNPYTVNSGNTIGISAFDSVDTRLVFPQAFVVATGVN